MDAIKIKTPELPDNKIIHIQSASTMPIDLDSRLQILLELYRLAVDQNGGRLVPFPYAEIMVGIEWNLDKASGSFTKRLGKWWYEHFKKSIPALTLARIGAMAAISDENKEFFFDIATKLDWERGQFGDSGSCMWSVHKAGLDYMSKSDDFRGIRFFKPVELGKGIWHADATTNRSYQGIARAWLWSHTMKFQQTATRTFEGKIYVVFNGYGYTSTLIAKVLANYLGYAQKEIQIANQRNRDTHIYINGDARLVAPKAFIDQITFIDFKQPI